MFLTGGMWMMDRYDRGYHGGMLSSEFNSDYGFFGPISLITFSFFTLMTILAIIWTIVIKGYSLWHAAQRKEKWWFIALLVINTFGLLEIIYLLFFAKIWTKDKSVKHTSHTHHAKGDGSIENSVERSSESTSEKKAE